MARTVRFAVLTSPHSDLTRVHSGLTSPRGDLTALHGTRHGGTIGRVRVHGDLPQRAAFWRGYTVV